MRVNTTLIMLLFLGLLNAPAFAAEEGHDAHPAAPSSLTATVTLAGGSLVADGNNGIMLHLKHAAADGGLPVLTDELESVHESRIHLLIVDPSLIDYHHEHPDVTGTAGDYAFFITPKTACSYKVWAQVHFKGGREETVTATIPGKDDCADKKPDPATVLAQSTDGYQFTMAPDTPVLRRGQDTMLTLSITGPDGQPFEGLEPVMGAFAHLVGFYDDYDHIAHIHPLGEEPTGVHERGGPELKFHYRPDRAGLVKMFAQVKIDGKMVFAPLTLTVTE